MNKKEFSSEALFAILSDLPQTNHYLVAFSGGIDSTVLLHALNQSRLKHNTFKITAIHVNHGINADADSWEVHCQKICSELNIDYKNMKIDARPVKGESPEAAARESRYKVLKDNVSKGDILLTGHHEDDQAETILLQLFRGSGVKGLASMGPLKPFGKGYLARPLLLITREQLEEYAGRENLCWIEDKSNEDVKYDRNFIRNKILPLIENRWPAAIHTMARSAKHQAELAEFTGELALSDYKIIMTDDKNSLNLEKINLLSEYRLKNVLFYWLRINDRPIPSSMVMQNIINEVINADHDSTPCVKWGSTGVRKYRNRIYVMPLSSAHDPEKIYTWEITNVLDLPGGHLKATKNKGTGIKSSLIENKKLSVKYRQGGEHIHPTTKPYNCKLKKLFQEKGILPWERNQIPLIYLDDKLIAVSDLWIEEDFSASIDDEGWVISFSKNIN